MVTKTFYWMLLSFFLAHLLCIECVSCSLFAAESHNSNKKEAEKKDHKLKEEDDAEDIEAQKSQNSRSKSKKNSKNADGLPAQKNNQKAALALQDFQNLLEGAQNEEEFDEEEMIGSPSSQQRPRITRPARDQVSPELLHALQIIAPHFTNQNNRLPTSGTSHDPVYSKVKKVSKRTKEQHTQTQKRQATIINRQNYNIVTTVIASVLIIILQWVIDNHTSSSTK